MKIKLKIQQKIQLFIISASIVIYIIAVGYISLNARKMAYSDATEVTNRYVHETANDVKAKLDADLTLVKTLADAFHTYKYLPTEQWQDLFCLFTSDLVHFHMRYSFAGNISLSYQFKKLRYKNILDSPVLRRIF